METYPEYADKVNMEIVVGGSGDPEVAQNFRLALASGEKCADIIQLNYTQVPEFARAGALQDLSDLMDPYKDNLTDAAIYLSQYDGQTIAVPNQVNSKLFYYRKDIFDECGVDPTTWKTVDDMIVGSEKIKEKYPDKYIHNWSYETGFQNYDMYMMFCNYDAKFVDDNGDYICDTDPGLSQAFTTLKKIYDSGIGMDCGDFTPDWGSRIGKWSAYWRIDWQLV